MVSIPLFIISPLLCLLGLLHWHSAGVAGHSTVIELTTDQNEATTAYEDLLLTATRPRQPINFASAAGTLELLVVNP